MPRRPAPFTRLRSLSLATLLLGALGLGGCASTPAGVDAQAAADAYTQLGLAYLERDNLPRALAALERALAHAPHDPEAQQALALLHQRRGEAALADAAFQRALQADPAFTQARNNYAALLYDQGRLDAACAQLERAAEDTQYRRRGQLFANLGRCRLAQGELSAARTSLERAQALAPDHADSYLHLAWLALRQNQPARARHQLDHYQRLAGDTPQGRALARAIADASDTR